MMAGWGEATGSKMFNLQTLLGLPAYKLCEIIAGIQTLVTTAPGSGDDPSENRMGLVTQQTLIN